MTRLQILVVDDDIGDRKLISRLVARIDATAEVREEESAEAALALPEAPVDAIFLDHRLPTLTGLSALARFRARWPAAALFLMIGQGDEDVAKSAILQGADDYVPKSNINQNALTRMLRTGLPAARLRTRLEEQRADLATFVEVLVHDFRAPIRATMSLSDQVSEDLDAGDLAEARDGLALLGKSAGQMMAMLGSLSDHVRLDREVAIEETDPVELVDRALLALALDIETSGAAIAVEVAQELPPIPCRAPQIAQVLQNLLANAIKYAGDGPPQIEIRALAQDSALALFEVRDHGRGIPAEYRDRVFEPFKRLPGAGAVPGTGLGLATCRKLVDRHGGRIWCEGGRAAAPRCASPCRAGRSRPGIRARSAASNARLPERGGPATVPGPARSTVPRPATGRAKSAAIRQSLTPAKRPPTEAAGPAANETIDSEFDIQ